MVEGLQMLPPISGSRIICEYAGEALYLDAGSEETGGPLPDFISQ